MEKNKIKVCHITSVHPPEDVRIHLKECISLQKAGYEVHLVAMRPCILKDTPITCHSFDYSTGSRILRFINSPKEALKVALNIDADIYHLHDPELLLISKQLTSKSKTVIFDAHEDLPKQVLTKAYIPLPIRRMTSWIVREVEKHYLKNIGNLITATSSIKKEMAGFASKAEVVNNFPFQEEFNNSTVSSNRMKNTFCYIGGISVIRGCTELVQAMDLIDAKCLVAGPVSDSYLETLKTEKGWSKIEFKGQVSRPEVSAILNSAVAGIVTFLPVPNHVEAQPNKMFEYMSAGLPVIGSHFPLWKEIIEGNECGICVDPEKPEELAQAMKHLIDQPDIAKKMGENGRKAILEKYNWEEESKELISFYQDLH